MKTPIFIFLFFCCGIVFSQKTDAQLKRDSIAFYLKRLPGKHKIKELKRAIILSEEIKNDSLIKVSYITFGIQNYVKKHTAGLDIAQQSLDKFYLRTKDSFALAKVYHYKALIHLINFKKDSSLYYYLESKKISALIKDSLEVGRRLLSMANMQREGRDNLGSEIYSIEGLQFLEPIKDVRFTGNLYNNLGLVSLRLNKYNDARVYFDKSKEIHEKNPSKRRKEIAGINYLLNTGNTYLNEKKYLKAIAYYKKGLEFDSLEIKYSKNYVSLSLNLSYSYLLNDEPQKAISGLFKSLKISEKKNNVSAISSNHNLIAMYYDKINNHKKALFHAKKALTLAQKAKFLRRELDVLLRLSNLKLVSFKDKNAYLKRYLFLKDSLIEEERTLKNQFAKIRYETGKKEKENVTLKVENEKKQLEIAQEKQQKIIGFLLAIGSFLFIGISFLVFKNRKKKLAFETQLQKAEVREQERQQIAKSLHDEVAGDLRLLHQQLEKINQVEVANQIDKVKNNVRNLSHELSSVHFDEVTFKDQMINLISDYFSLECKILINGLKEHDWRNIENPIKRTLYLCARECLQNANKHAKATQIKMILNYDKNKVYLMIEDNGVGFDFSEKVNGIGLKNQRERVEEINGNIEIKSVINKGTIINLEIPIHV
jgi:signal transduction histidine kinase